MKLPVLLFLSVGVLWILPVEGQQPAGRVYYDSGGVPIKEQTAFDVTYYELDLKIDPVSHSIDGSLRMQARSKRGLDVIVLHLDTLLEVKRVTMEKPVFEPLSLRWTRKGGLLFIYPVLPVISNDLIDVKVEYAGAPLRVKDARRRSWSDGFYFEETPDGHPWVGNVSVLNGADIWWPCKDHPSDEPDSMSIRLTVDQDLVAVSNGRLREIIDNPDDTKTYHWFVSTPINNYAVTVNIAPYKTIETEFTSVSGDTFPFIFWVIPEHYEKAKAHFPNLVQDMKFMEEYLGPYPFRADKYGVAETFYFGMETQSIIAYGHDFTLNEYGFDYLHSHELAHEWFANMVTAVDWKHWWIHEGFATYMEPLYAEYLGGEEAYNKYMKGIFSRIQNKAPVVLFGDHVSSRQGYIGDVYAKGAAILHTLRYLLGKEKILKVIRQMAYPTRDLEQVTDGSHTRLSSSEEFQQIAEAHYGSPLDWFFDAYLNYKDLPLLSISQEGKQVHLKWETGSDLPFVLPVPVKVGRKQIVVPMEAGKGSFRSGGKDFTIDPGKSILMKVGGD